MSTVERITARAQRAAMVAAEAARAAARWAAAYKPLDLLTCPCHTVHMTYYVKIQNVETGAERWADGSFSHEDDAMTVAHSWREIGYRAQVVEDHTSPAAIRDERRRTIDMELATVRAMYRRAWTNGDEDSLRLHTMRLRALGREQIALRNT